MIAALKLQTDSDSERLSDTVYETLLNAILSGKLRNGSIVSEVSLSKQLGVSRTPVHDALRQLAKDGLVEQNAGRRAMIAAFTREDIHDIFDMRRLLECEAARRAASGIDHATLAKLRAMSAELKTKVGTVSDAQWIALWTDFDEVFHDAIGKASGSTRLWHDIVRYRTLHRGFNRLSTTVESLQRAVAEHDRILDALEKRDADNAAARMGEHIREWQAYFVNHFPR